MAIYAELLDDPPSMVEQGGAPYEFRVKYLITGFTGTNAGILFDALNASGLPKALEVCPYSDNLLVVNRIPRVVGDGENRMVYVEIVYQRRRKVVFQQTGDNFVVTVGSTLQEIETAFDLNGQQVSVEHTYDSSDPDYPSTTLTQGGTVRVLRPQATRSFQGVLSSNFPDGIQREYEGRTNIAPWGGDPAGTWLCVAVNFRSSDVSSFIPRWEFQFDFQHNIFGWDDYAVFIDRRTGTPPPDLVPGTGYKQLTLYARTDFNRIFAI